MSCDESRVDARAGERVITGSPIAHPIALEKAKPVQAAVLGRSHRRGRMAVRVRNSRAASADASLHQEVNMFARRRTPLLIGFMASATLACSKMDNEKPVQASAPPTQGASEISNSVMNAFPASHGDVRAAFATARKRFAGKGRALPRFQTEANGVPSGALVLYDTTGPWGWLGELYAMNVGALAGHFGSWTAHPVTTYAAGELSAYAGVIYVGSTFDEPLSAALLDDVLQTTQPVLWIDDNIWQLAARAPSFSSTYGFDPWIYDTTDVAAVDYGATALTRYLPDASGIMTYSSVTTARVLAQAVHASDGTTFPWAIRGNNLTYIGENPMSYVTANDRYLAFSDLLFDTLAPATPTRHRALVRIEDVDSTSDPRLLRAMADYLSSQSVPFGLALIPHYLDPLGYYNDGGPQDIPLAQAPEVVSAVQYMLSKGGVLVMHGYTHQYASVADPYDGVTADDCEFYSAHIDPSNFVIFDGPIAGDSQTWADGRITAGLSDLSAAGLPTPAMFEYPHYAGSSADSYAVLAHFATAYHRGLYASGLLSGAPIDNSHVIGVVYPYAGLDVFGFKVLPESMGDYEPVPFNNNPARLVPDMLATAQANLVVRDGFASFFIHWYDDLAVLQQLVAGVKAAGYTFVSPSSL